MRAPALCLVMMLTTSPAFALTADDIVIGSTVWEKGFPLNKEVIIWSVSGEYVTVRHKDGTYETVHVSHLMDSTERWSYNADKIGGIFNILDALSKMSPSGSR